MATIPASENEFPQLLFTEVAAPSTPATGLVVCYVKSDGLLYCKDDAGTETAYGALTDHLADTTDAHDASAISVLDTAAVFTATNVETALKELYDAIAGGGISATIFAAKGDILGASANDTPAILSVGSNNARLRALSTEATGLKWDAQPVFSRALISGGNSTGIGGSFTDITGYSITVTTLARPVLIGAVIAVQVGGANDAVALDIDIDGVRQGGTNGLTGERNTTTSHRMNMSFTYMSDVLSAGSHTFKLQGKRISGSSTVTVLTDSTDNVGEFWVMELGSF